MDLVVAVRHTKETMIPANVFVLSTRIFRLPSSLLSISAGMPPEQVHVALTLSPKRRCLGSLRTYNRPSLVVKNIQDMVLPLPHIQVNT